MRSCEFIYYEFVGEKSMEMILRHPIQNPNLIGTNPTTLFALLFGDDDGMGINDVIPPTYFASCVVYR
jgi:hypothetical protein